MLNSKEGQQEVRLAVRAWVSTRQRVGAHRPCGETLIQLHLITPPTFPQSNAHTHAPSSCQAHTPPPSHAPA